MSLPNQDVALMPDPAALPSSVLSARYDYDGEAILVLSAEQRDVVARITDAVSSGRYRFEAVPCAVCDREDFEVLATKDRYGLYFPVVICRDCGLVQTNPRMDAASYGKFYEDDFAPLYRGSATAVEAHFRFREAHGRKVVQYLRKVGALGKALKDTLVVDIGCSHGGVLRAFQKAGFQTRGLDLNADYLELGRERYGMDLEQGDLSSARFERPPDIVLYCQVFEHIGDPVSELSALRAVAGPDTQVYIEVPGIRTLFPRYHMDFLRILQNAHVYHYTIRSLTNLMAKNGFALSSGNDTIESVFRLKGYADLAPTVNDYESAMAWLRRAECMRSVYPGGLVSSLGRLTRTLRTGLRGASD